MNVLEAEKSFTSLVDRVHREGICIDLERDNEVIARLTPASSGSGITVTNLASFLRTLPPLGEDADAFAEDIRAIRNSTPPEASPWE